MIQGYLLDTNALSELVRDGGGQVALRAKRAGFDIIATSVVAAGELRYGAIKRGSRRLADRVAGVLARIAVLPFEPPMDQTYGRLRAALEAAGTPVGGNDLLIAAQALTLDRCVVTANVREFSRIDGLVVENWLH